MIPTRRPRTEEKRSGENFTACPKCKGFYTKNNVRHHYAKYANKNSNSQRILAAAKIAIGRIHPVASAIMRRYVVPYMQEDEVTRVVRYDKLLMLYGNKLCCEHRQQYHHSMIRTRLRLLGRFLIELRKINSEITDFSSLYDAKHYRNAIDS